VRRASAAICVFLACAYPGAAIAQSAGAEQYQDPLAGSQVPSGGGSNSNGSGSNSNGSTSTGSNSGAASPTTSSATQGQGSGTGTTTSGVRASETLPATGLPLPEVWLTGAAMLLGGLALRRAANRLG
jgi:hypothetical protein